MYGQYSGNSHGRNNPLARTPKTGKRQKQVYDIAEIPHLWAHKTQGSARNAQGNFYFADGVIYSYGSHFPIAAHVQNKRGQAAILFTTDSYGPTTGRHVSTVRRAIPSDAVIFYVPLNRSMLPDSNGTLDCERIIAAYQSNVKTRVQDALGARLTTVIQRHLDEAHAERNELLRFVQFFGLPALSERARIESRKLPTIPPSVDAAKDMGRKAKQEAARIAKVNREATAEQYKQRIQEWMERNPEYAARWDGTTEHAETLATEHSEAKRARQLKERDARALAELTQWMSEHADVSAQWDGTAKQGENLRYGWENTNRARLAVELLQAWMRGESVSIPGYSYDSTYLRIVGDTVETSRGANFPMSHAVRGLALVRSVMARGEDWHTNGHTCHLGHYRIDRITADGTVYAGCHVVPFASIERIAVQLEAYSAPLPEVQACRKCGATDRDMSYGVCVDCEESM